MKKIYSEYIELNDEEKNNLWTNAIFVFDTNVLLNLYRYSERTRNNLFEAFDVLKDRIWLPYNVGMEFLKNRCGVIYDTLGQHNTLNNLKTKFVEDCKNAFRLDSKDQEITELSNYIENWINDNNNKNITVTDPSNDAILERILKLFDGKVGNAYTEEELKALYIEGERRYQSKTPPGYKDKSKQREDDDNNLYGDWIIWRQILDYAKINETDIIFITHDQKDDWWIKTHGKTVGPRFELKKEFTDVTLRYYLMYSMDNFIKYFNEYNDNIVDQKSIDEVKSIEGSIDEAKSLNEGSREEVISILDKYKFNEEKLISRINFLKECIDDYNMGLDTIAYQYKDCESLPEEVQENIFAFKYQLKKYLSELYDLQHVLERQKNDEYFIKHIKNKK